MVNLKLFKLRKETLGINSGFVFCLIVGFLETNHYLFEVSFSTELLCKGAAFLRAGTAKDLTLADVGIWGISFVTPDGCCCSQCPAAPCWNLLGQTEDLLSEILTQYCL